MLLISSQGSPALHSLQMVLHADERTSDLLAGEHGDVCVALFVVEV